MNEPLKRKRIYLINRDFQLRYTMSAVVVGLVSTLLTSVVILAPLYTFKILRIPDFLPLPVLSGMVLAALINILLVGLMGIIITHKIAGPMYSLVRQFRRVEAGYWNSPLRLRQSDELKFVVRNFNEMLAAVVKDSSEDLTKIEGLMLTEQDPNRRQLLQDLHETIQRRLGTTTEQV